MPGGKCAVKRRSEDNPVAKNVCYREKGYQAVRNENHPKYRGPFASLEKRGGRSKNDPQKIKRYRCAKGTKCGTSSTSVKRRKCDESARNNAGCKNHNSCRGQDFTKPE